MSYISEYIDKLNKRNRKALSIFLTAGFPVKNAFVDLAKNILDAGADMIEIGIPFSDPLADGPIIQASSNFALDSNVNLKNVFEYSESIAAFSPKPVILMGYANPIRKYGIINFFNDAAAAGVRGLIVPDIPIEEYNSFFSDHIPNNFSIQDSKDKIDVILLTTPTSSDERIQAIDSRSSGFVYCVSMTGTTGIKNNFNNGTQTNLQRTRSLLKTNKMMIGFGISKPEDIIDFSPFCDGVIVGSQVINSLLEGDILTDTFKIVSSLSEACDPGGGH